MSRPQSFRISLAGKCRILFGWAVLLIIATALLVPWYYMERLVDQLNVNETRHLARLARNHLRPAQPDWDTQQAELDRWWTANAGALHLPQNAPRFIKIPYTGDDAFIRQAIQTLTDNDQLPERRTVEQGEGGHSLYRLAIAVRTPVPPQTTPSLVGIVVADLPSDESDAQLWPNRIVIVIAGAFAGFLAILVFYLITHRLILSPIRSLKAVVEKVAAGDLSIRSDVQTGDEFEELARAMNDMLTHLQKSQEEIETVNRSLEIRLGELAETNVALYEANKLKSEFLANVTHELRTPMTSIIGFAELLGDASRTPGETDPVRIARYARNILTSGRELLEQINNLLDYAKTEAGKMTLHRTRFALRDICEALVDFTRPLIDKKNQRLDLIVPEDLPAMHSDAGKIQQVLYNLLSNAIKFTPDGGVIRLEVRRHGHDAVSVSVSDSGPGIPPEEHEAIFEKFRQLDSSMTREHSGTGLGLSISRELAGMLGGRITLDSHPGQGATFTVILPVECPEKPPVRLIHLT